MSALKPTYHDIKGKKSHEIVLECGVDEAGVGCLAGPVVSAAVIFPYELDDEYKDCLEFKMLRDSKKLTEKQREKIELFVKEVAIDWKVAFVDNTMIDDINIKEARFLSMRRAIDGLCIIPEFLLIDGNMFPDPEKLKYKTKYKCIIGGDNLYQSIAAASILAKCARDRYMIKLAKEYPNYGWESNKGYGTKAHYLSIKEHGITPFHRESFNLCIKGTNYDSSATSATSATNATSKTKIYNSRNAEKCLIDDSESE
jgi:ribonuclease HII